MMLWKDCLLVRDALLCVGRWASVLSSSPAAAVSELGINSKKAAELIRPNMLLRA
jgi:hypothetical protein